MGSENLLNLVEKSVIGGKFSKLRGRKGEIIKILPFLFLLFPCYLGAFEYYNQVDKYDIYFSKYSKSYFGPDFDWRFFKAQAIAESRLQPDAESEDGAVGIMQLLPRTFKHLIRKNPEINGDIRKPRCNIEAGIYYDKLLWDEWDADRPFRDRINFMFASYNAGKNAILEGQQIAMEKGLDPFLWKSIKEVLSLVKGGDSRETISYVAEIQRIRKALR